MSGGGGAAELLSSLESELRAGRLDDEARRKLLEQLKVIGRNPAQAQPIFTCESTKILCQYAFETGEGSASKEAMRCLANAMLLNEPTRQFVLDLHYAGKAADRMRSNDRDDEFLTSRILFFASYTGKLDVKGLVKNHSLVQSLQRNLEQAVKRLDEKSPNSTPMVSMAFEETLKLLPNLVYYSPDTIPDLSPLLAPLAILLIRTPLPSTPLQPPVTHLINATLNLNPPPSKVEDAALRESLYPPENTSALTDRLVSILHTSMPTQTSAKDDITLSPLLSFIRNLHTTAPDDVRLSVRAKLLPDDATRDQPLGKDDSLPSRLLRAATAPATSTTRDVVSALLYEMSDENSSKLVANVGYGYAVGILARLGKEVDAGQEAGAGQANGTDANVNPVTGQKLDKEEMPELDDMTEEEKEREAERLFVLFERLKATGVMDVVNPVEQAMREGKFEDVD